MTRSLSLSLFFLFFALVPMILAWNQNVPTRFAYQGVVLFVSLAAFGLLLGQFWLTRLLSRNVTEMKLFRMLRWHKVIGYSAGAIMLLHPVLIIARRFWAEESDPVDNLLLMLRSPALLPALIAWILLALIVLLALVRRSLPPKSRRILHGLLSSSFAGLAAWHVVTVGRHSNLVMSAFWIALAAAAITAMLFAYLPARWKTTLTISKGTAHETAG